MYGTIPIVHATGGLKDSVKSLLAKKADVVSPVVKRCRRSPSNTKAGTPRRTPPQVPPLVLSLPVVATAALGEASMFGR